MVFGFIVKPLAGMIAKKVGQELAVAAITRLALGQRVARLETKLNFLIVVTTISAGIAVAALVLALVR